MDSKTYNVVVDEIAKYRDNLLDSSRRNKFLNFTPSKYKSIKIVGENILSIFDMLVLKERKMQFLAKDLNESDNLDVIVPEFDNSWDMDDDNVYHEDSYLRCDDDQRTLEKKLLKLSRDYKSTIEEKGFNSLYIAFGFLEWNDSSYYNKTSRAPLILVPLTMSRSYNSFKIAWNFEDVKYNLTLKYVLADMNIKLPEFESLNSKEDVIKYIESVEKVVSHRKGWKVTSDIYVSIFSFKKLAMYEDLNPSHWKNLKENNISKLYFNKSEDEDTARVLDYTDNYRSLNNFNVLDADSSQQEVIQNIKNGVDLVVEGPPGTGKSQTIVNIIAELLALGKSVLFVSEKKVALDVVKNRLDNVELGDMCLELHGENHNKKAFIMELASTLNLMPTTIENANLYNHLDDVKDNLIAYSDKIYDEFGQTGLSPYDFIGMFMDYQKQYDNLDKDFVDVPIGSVDEITREDYDKIIDNLNRIAQQYRIVGPVKSNQWRNTDIGQVDVSNLAGIRGDLETVYYDSSNLYDKINYLTELIDAHPSNNDTINEVIDNLALLSNNLSNMDYKNHMTSLINLVEEYQTRQKDVDIKDNINYVKVVERYNDINNRIAHSPFKSEYLFNGELEDKLARLKKVHDAIVQNPLSHLISDNHLNDKILLFEKYRNTSLIRLINRDYDNIRNNLRGYYTHQCTDDEIFDDLLRMSQYKRSYANLRAQINSYCNARMSYGQLFEQYNKVNVLKQYLYKLKNQIGCSDYSIIEFEDFLKEAQELQLLKQQIDKEERIARYLFGDVWNSTDSNTKKLYKKIEVYDDIKDLEKQGFYTENSLNLMKNISPDEYKQSLNDIRNLRDKLELAYDKINNLLSLKTKEFNKIHLHELNDLNEYYKSFLDNIHKINDYRIFDNYTNIYLNKYTRGIIEKIKLDKIEANKIVETFKVNFVREALRIIFYDPTLNQFNYQVHNYTIDEFQQLDKEAIRFNRKRIRNMVLERQPDINSNLQRYSSLGLINKEISKKSKHLPIRKTLASTTDIITQIKPCFMMSPMSIAQYLDPEYYESYFDYVIFDEASQVKIEDSFGALLRGKNYIIMGDTRQLPPTTFFDASVENEEDEDELYSTIGIESILEHAKVTLQTKMLKWHYRSRHDSLIAVSNKEFYNNELFVYPSSHKNRQDQGLHLEYDPETIYEKGRSTSNPQEADNIIEYLFKLISKYDGKKTIGIATFSKKQRDVIDDKLQDRLREDDKYSSFFEDKKDNFFIKNLENIQGDEKDIILISMGYGFDKDHRISMNFGPLNKDGGERRLNVLISRAKEQCIVFSNFKAQDMSIERTTPQGLKSLKTFLYYAEKGTFPQQSDTSIYDNAGFEQHVYNTLIEHGYNVDMKVGTAGYKIDLAVVDPIDKDEYILAIECDGASYHSSNSVRDRDRLRQQVLENLGWNFYRVWSTDWYQNEEEATKRLLNKINEVTTQSANT